MLSIFLRDKERKTMSTTNTGEDTDALPSTPPLRSIHETSPLFDEETDLGRKNPLLHRSSHDSSPSTIAAADEDSKKTDSNSENRIARHPQLPRRNLFGLVRSPSQKNLVKIGDKAFYIDEEGKVLDVKVTAKDGDSNHPTYTIKLPDESVKEKVHHTEVFKTHPTVHKILCVLNLCEETDRYLREDCPTLTSLKLFSIFPSK